jgi:hypothetical protein
MLSGFLREQLRKDEELLQDQRVNKLEYHFVPSGDSHTIGPSRSALDELRALKQRHPGKVEIYIYPPS